MNNLFPPVPNVDNVTDIHSWGLVRDWLTKITLLLNNNPPVTLGGTQGLTGANDSIAPNIKFNFSATVIVLRNRLGAGQFVSLGPGYNFACDLTIQGVGGRDQATAFGPNTFVHFYFIFNPTNNNLTTMASLAAQDQGPVLPSGYSHFTYIGAVSLDGSGNLRQGHIAGTLFTYNNLQQIINGGQALASTSVPTSTLVPPNATVTIYELGLHCVVSSGIGIAGFFRPTGYTTFDQYLTGESQVATGATFSSLVQVELAPGVGRSIDYYISAAPTSGGVYGYVAGYRMPNSAS